MAKNSADQLTWLLEIRAEHLSDLGHIRHWKDLKIARDKEVYWIKGLTGMQVQSIEIKSIPFKHIYYEDDHKLFPAGSSLPVKKMPSALLWTPMEKGIPVSLPALNYNYFGLNEKVAIGLVPSETEHAPAGIIVPLKTLSVYVETAPEVRLNSISWVINGETAILLGTPLLPIQGETLWMREHFLLPAGYDFELNLLSGVMSSMVSVEQRSWIIWNVDSTCSSIPRSAFKPLTRSSFRLSITNQEKG